MTSTLVQKNIPSGWQSIFVDDLCYVMKGQGLSKKYVDPSGKNKCILYGELFTTYNEVIKDVKSKTNSNEGVLSVGGDILVPGSTTTVARDLAIASSLNEDNVLLGGDINILRKKDDYYDSNFLAYYLTHYKKDEIGKLGQGTTIVHLYGSNIKNLEVIIPKDVKEQQKIAVILGAVDEDIAKTQEVIATTEKLKRGLMQQLFSRGIGYTKFKETKIGQIPEDWEVVAIKDAPIKLIDGDRGVNYPGLSDFTSGGYCLFLNNKNIKNDQFVFSDIQFISREKDEKLRKGKLQRLDVVLTTRGTVGNVAFYDKSVTFENIRINSGMILLRAFEEISPAYLYHLMKSPFMKKRYAEVVSGSAQPQLPIRSLEQIFIPIPLEDEQEKIVKISQSIDEKISVNKKLKAKLTTLKKGLMQDLLSGKVRVKN